MDDYINSDKIDVINTLTTNLKSEISFEKNNSIPICYYQVFEINSIDKDNINNINQDTMVLWQEIICRSGYLLTKKININDISNCF